MKDLKASGISKMLLLSAVCAGSLLLGFVCRESRIEAASAQPAFGQSDYKQVDIKRFPNEPYRIGNLRVRSTKIAPAQPFSAKSLTETEAIGTQAGDWLENFEFTIKNQYDRPMTYILLEFDFPETGVNAPLMVYSRVLGIPPNPHPEEVKRGKPFSLNPGETTTFTLSATDLQRMREFLSTRNFQLVDLNKIVIRIANVAFDDGVKWQQGTRYRPNPMVRGGYEEINQ